MQGSAVTELGRMLREARESKNVTLTDAQQATKIRLLFLQALETNNYAVLPPPFYIRGFIKTYATYLGLDPKQAVQIFDEMVENVALTGAVEQRQVQPSADSGGRGTLPATAGLSQGEAKMVEASNERLNVSPLPSSNPVGHGSADSSGENRALMRLDHTITTGLRAPDKYVLKPAMLPTARGTFYMPNFIPAVLVGIIVLAACLLVYRGLSSQNKLNGEEATLTPGASVSASSSSVFQSGLKTTLATTQTASSTSALRSGASEAAGSLASGVTARASVTTAASSTQAATSAPPTPIQVATPTAEPTPTAAPAPATVKVEVFVSNDDAKGSWMDITVDGEKKVSKLAGPGETFTFEGKKVSVRAGKPAVVSVKINGEARDYTKPGAGIITHTWFADGKDVIE